MLRLQAALDIQGTYRGLLADWEATIEGGLARGEGLDGYRDRIR